ncbi:hypothetical protein HYALB_00012067 [Hymenoscyphus albidus]|uniref:Uncharacterized protein n=1 Tax=Hymenoscyphus albidus TaxID=595503 RepID=A0A9N9LP80_9HELO|nr:hypothetical protein HYALB_00012067 [Hymenoscyphus albidus]
MSSSLGTMLGPALRLLKATGEADETLSGMPRPQELALWDMNIAHHRSSLTIGIVTRKSTPIGRLNFAIEQKNAAEEYASTHFYSSYPSNSFQGNQSTSQGRPQ